MEDGGSVEYSPLNRANDSSSTSSESLFELSLRRPELEIVEGELSFLNLELDRGETLNGELASDVAASEGEEGVSSDSGEDLTVERRGDEMGDWREREGTKNEVG